MANIIKDKSLAPYLIRIDEYQYIVSTETKAKRGKEYRNISYHSTLGYAVRYICKLRAISVDGEVDMAEYVLQVEGISKEIMDRLKF